MVSKYVSKYILETKTVSILDQGNFWITVNSTIFSDTDWGHKKPNHIDRKHFKREIDQNQYFLILFFHSMWDTSYKQVYTVGIKVCVKVYFRVYSKVNEKSIEYIKGAQKFAYEKFIKCA